ncbi:hypothetical protein OUY22_22690 [Nonomuraea sp. MCN248]|uniref:Lipoprotein n=1 Tax=Nonomuraea corallina TaxID=2989783 RepID=A0ABT4SGB0_9ACTN|nr:DUF6624 domain-containing protein [Nonomuraea corallina]MDA0636239.1 hypothetical protein [Nonomuraea corallina]
MRTFLTCLLAVLLLATACGDDAPSDPRLRAELLEMLRQDQKVRAPDAAEADWDRVERANTERMREIIDQHGWPGYALVGEDGEDAAWALVQHADRDLDLQRRALALLGAAVAEGDASPGNLAYLEDRVRVAEGRPQRYGTQWEMTQDGQWKPRTPIEDEAGVEERRAEAGLQPLAEYLEELKSVG